MDTSLRTVEVEAQQPIVGSVIWLHGLGASGHDFEPIVPALGLPAIRFVFPHAPERAVTINRGMVMPALYDIRSIARGPDREDEADIRRSAKQVEDLIAREEQRGVPPEQVVLAGFSQGAAMALHVGLRQKRPLLGLLVLSGYLVLESVARLEGLGAEWEEASEHVPTFCSHGTRDGVVPVGQGRAAFERIDNGKREALWRDYRMMHEVCPEQVGHIASWLRQRFDSLGLQSESGGAGTPPSS
ncbi:MAG: alpha/beta fold hydrolase [Myxococcota bacterium]|nr:alpha/beta fold hydrolase [Myxococcota bacterium]